MSIIKTTKVDYKLKDVKFENDMLTDENGEIINLVEDLYTIFGDRTFTLTASFQNKAEYDVEDFAK